MIGNMRLFSKIFLISSVLFLASCTDDGISKEDNNVEQNEDGTLNGGDKLPDEDDTSISYVIKAFIGDKESLSRATVSNTDGKSFMWQAGDKFDMYLNDAPSVKNEFSIIDNTISGDAKSADFSCENFQVSETAESYTAFYPAGMFVSTSDSFTFKIPAEVYTQSGNNSTEHLKTGLAMLASGTYDSQVSQINFKHKTSLMRFGFTNQTEGYVTVKSVRLVSTENCFGSQYSYTIGGKETYNDVNNNITLSLSNGIEIPPYTSLKSYTLTMRGDDITDNADFYIEAELSDGTTVKSESFKGSEINKGVSGFDKSNGNYWLPGYYYSFNLDLKENSLDFTGITCGISPWVDDENTDKGEIKPDIE